MSVNIDLASVAAAGRTRLLQPRQRSELRLLDLEGKSSLLLTTDVLIEAPNWSPDGRVIYFNAKGRMFQLVLASRQVELLDFRDLPAVNNDHVIAPDGQTMYVSCEDGHLYALSMDGARCKRISNTLADPRSYYLHGVSPDGSELAYVGVRWRDGLRLSNIYTIASSGGSDHTLTDWSHPSDGPEYSRDGGTLYFNTEAFSSEPGLMQIAQMPRGGGEVVRMTAERGPCWFPHVSPDGNSIAFLSYPAATLGHPPDRDVHIKLMRSDGSNVLTLTSFFGGQGSLNVNSWSPDGRSLAYVAYPI